MLTACTILMVGCNQAQIIERLCFVKPDDKLTHFNSPGFLKASSTRLLAPMSLQSSFSTVELEAWG